MKNTLPRSPRLSRIMVMLGVAVLMYLIRHFGSGQASPSKSPAESNTPASASKSYEKQILQELASHKLYFTQHAKCRMDCRHIDESEIKDIMQRGHINERKSDPQDAPCPTYALEGNTKDGQEVRIVLGACDNETKVITVIDLGKDHVCNCK